MTGLYPVRLLVAAGFAGLVTLSLFLLMQMLVSLGSGRHARLEPIPGIRFGPVEIPDEIQLKSRIRPDRPPPPDDPPPPPRMQLANPEQAARDLPDMDLPRFELPLVAGSGLYLGDFEQVDRSAEGDIVPVVVIQPIYPREAAISGIEGWVKVEFTITETGMVRNPRVIDAQPPRIFNREAIRAILKWKFKPRVVDGVAVERQASQVIDFKLQER